MARDSNHPAPPAATASISLTAECLFAANAVAGGGEHPGLPVGWVEEQRSQLPSATLAFLPRLQGFWWPTLGLVDFLCHNGEFDDPAAFADSVARWSMPEFLAVLFNEDLTSDEAADLLARPETAAALAPRLSRFSQGSVEALQTLFRDPEGHRRGLLDLVRASDTPALRDSFATLGVQAHATVHGLRRRLAGEDAVSVAESLRSQPLPPNGRRVDRVTFVPSRLIGHRHIVSWGARHLVFFLQEGAVPIASLTETGGELAEFLKVLGDKTRMDILRLLCCGPSFGKEIATSLGLTTATVSRHLDQLKEAGLVREEKADANNVKRLRYVPETLEAEFQRLRDYLLHS